MRMRAAENDHGDAGDQQHGMPADRCGFTLEARHQVGDGDVQETRRGDGDDHRNPLARIVQGVVAGQSADDRGEARYDVPE